MSLSEFRGIRLEITELLRQADEEYELNKDNPDFNSDENEEKFINQYLALQNRLLSHDLSDIPFEEWKGMEILSDDTHIADFSKTRANIDFNLIDYYGHANFSGCNVRNLDKLGSFLNPKDFDEKTILENPKIFLSDLFSDEFKEKYYSGLITIEDLTNLSSSQLEELKDKNVEVHLDHFKLDSYIFKTFGMEKLIELYHYSQEEYNLLNQSLAFANTYYRHMINTKNNTMSFDEYVEQLKNADISDVKKICYSYMRDKILNSWPQEIRLDLFPELFVKENPDIFLTDPSIPNELRTRYYKHKLTLDDVMQNIELFENMPVENFMDYDYRTMRLYEGLGYGNLQKIIKMHPDVIEYIMSRENASSFLNHLNPNLPLEENFSQMVKKVFQNYVSNNNIKNYVDGQVVYDIPKWLSSMNFTFIDSIHTKDELLNLTNKTVIVDSSQQLLIDAFNLENIKRFERETGFFSHSPESNPQDLLMFNALVYSLRSGFFNDINFHDGILSYPDFNNAIADCIDVMRKHKIFTDYPDYDWMQGEFRDEHPAIFIDSKAPEELRDAFYKNNITPKFLYNHREYVPFLVDKNMNNTLNANIKLVTKEDENTIKTTNFIDEYVARYGNEKLLNLVVKYGDILLELQVECHGDFFENEESVERAVRDSIFAKIVNDGSGYNYSYLENIPEFVSEHPDIFVSLKDLDVSDKEKDEIRKAIYTKRLSKEDIKKFPQLLSILKDKNLNIIMSTSNGELELLQVYGNEHFLEMCSKYGKYMNGMCTYLHDYVTLVDGSYIDLRREGKNVSFEEISTMIENIITKECLAGNIQYQPTSAPDFLKEHHPELFLDENAPEELQRCFYNIGNNYYLTFEVLKEHKEWMPYLKDKAISTSLLHNRYLKRDIAEFLELFGDERAIKLGINRTETVTTMLKNHNVSLMKKWYDKTGGKFIPDYIVMQNFPLEEADKFLISGSNWSNLMRIKGFANLPDHRDAMLKLAYSFGAFDQDQRGFKKLQELLTGLPRRIDPQYKSILERIDESIDNNSQYATFFRIDHNVFFDYDDTLQMSTQQSSDVNIEEVYEKMIEHVKTNFFYDRIDNDTLVNFLEAMQKEKVNLDFSKSIFSQFYRKNEDGSHTLTINSQSYPQTSKAIRNILEKFDELPILTPSKAHHYIGGFKMEYDSEFREFFLANFDKIIKNNDYLSNIAPIQRRFEEIKTLYSNIPLTLELALSFIDDNRYENVDIGNEGVARVAAINQYSQSDFEILQEIYNYGKQRTFSSIPRVEGKRGQYTYQLLRLDDPLAMAIGKLSDCCQRLGEPAELCMEHSMVDKNGRVFVIYDENGELVAQSWVWRNKDVLCFDNIEVPDQQMWNHGIERGREDSGIRNDFTDEILDIYKQAAHELIVEDEKVYRSLLDAGKISQEQYEGLRLGKITTGEGYSNIKGSFETLELDNNIHLDRPLPFVEPVKLQRGLYTNDSATRQYILEEREDRKPYSGDTLAVHNDLYVEYDDNNFSEKQLLTLEKLEIVTKENPQYLETKIKRDTDEKHLVTELAKNYDLSPDTTKVIVHPNFAIIYDTFDDGVRIGDLLFNTKINSKYQPLDIESTVTKQIGLALEQIGKEKQIDISRLDERQKEMYAKAVDSMSEIDVERGVGHAR